MDATSRKPQQSAQSHMRAHGYTACQVGPPGGARRISVQNKVEPMMTRFVMATMAAGLLGCGAAFAQVGGMGVSPPLGVTSPLGIGPGSAVPPTGLRLGPTEGPTLAVRPTTSGPS